MKKTVFFGCLVMAWSLVGLATNGIPHYPEATAPEVPSSYDQWFRSRNVTGQYYSSLATVSEIAQWYEENTECSLIHSELGLAILVAETHAVVVQDKSQQLDPEFKKMFPKIAILHLGGEKEAVHAYLELFREIPEY